MGFFKRLLGLSEDDAKEEAPSSAEPATRGAERRGERKRPPLPEHGEGPGTSQSVEDVLAAREAGDRDGARAILRDIDRGGGLRTVLRAAAALEAGDEDELAPLLPIVAADEPLWTLPLQIGAALDEPGARAKWIARAKDDGAPAWGVAWAAALSSDAVERRRGLVDLLFADASLARTVAARDLAVENALPDTEAARRYAAFAHGRDSIRRFGASVVAAAVDRAAGRRP